MRQLKSYKTTTFADGDFRIDIVEKKSEYEAWLYHKDYGVKNFMFGSGKQIETFDSFVDLVEANLATYKRIYKDEHFETVYNG